MGPRDRQPYVNHALSARPDERRRVGLPLAGYRAGSTVPSVHSGLISDPLRNATCSTSTKISRSGTPVRSASWRQSSYSGIGRRTPPSRTAVLTRTVPNRVFTSGKPFIVRSQSGLRKLNDIRLGIDLAGQVEAVGRDLSTSPKQSRVPFGQISIRGHSPAYPISDFSFQYVCQALGAKLLVTKMKMTNNFPRIAELLAMIFQVARNGFEPSTKGL